MYKIEFSYNSRKNFWDIFLFIATDNPLIGIEVQNNIKNTISYLKDYPYIWTKYKSNLRKLVNSKYKFVIIYKINEINKTIIIVSIFKYTNNF
jgi:plasmid stabilization system protein ParE